MCSSTRSIKEIEPIIVVGTKYRKLLSDYEGAKEILQEEKDEDLREMAKKRLPGRTVA